MKFLLYTLLLFFAVPLIAQPTIGPEAIVQLGESEPNTFFNSNSQNWDSGKIGEDVAWDFSTLPMGTTCDYMAMDPTESPYFDSFPDSDIFFRCPQSDGIGLDSDLYTFYNIEDGLLQLAGSVSISISNPDFDSIFIVFTDPLEVATFPYNYQDQTEGTFEARVSTYTSNLNLVAIQTGTSMHEVDSYGTLTTPAGTFLNAIRVKRTELAETSLPGIPFSTFQESYRYTWYAENEKGVILNLDSLVTKDFSGNVVLENFVSSYRINPPTSTATETIEEIEWTVHSRTMTTEIEVQIADINNYKLAVYDLQGAVIPYSTLDQSNNGKIIRLEGAVSTGIYYISLMHERSGKILSKGLFLNTN